MSAWGVIRDICNPARIGPVAALVPSQTAVSSSGHVRIPLRLWTWRPNRSTLSGHRPDPQRHAPQPTCCTNP